MSINEEGGGPNLTESFVPSISEYIVEELCTEDGRFTKSDLDGEDIYLEKYKKGGFYPDSRFFIFPEAVISIDDPKIEEVFFIRSINRSALRDIRDFALDNGNFKEDSHGNLFGFIKIGSVNSAVRKYKDTDKEEVRNILRERKSKGI